METEPHASAMEPGGNAAAAPAADNASGGQAAVPKNYTGSCAAPAPGDTETIQNGAPGCAAAAKANPACFALPPWAAALLAAATVLAAVAAACAAALCIRFWPLGNAAAVGAAAALPDTPRREGDAACEKESSAVPGLPESAAPPSAGQTASAAPAGHYQQEWPALYATPLPAAEPPEKTVYLTFDDGPSANTARILQTLADYGAQATWFVTGSSIAAHEDELLAIARAGHALGLHSDTHEYKEIYASVENFLADMDAVSARVEQLTGQRCGLLRFPGGSINSYNAGLYQPLCAEVLRRGYRYYDWNASAQDAVSPQRSAADTARLVIDGVHANRWSVVLLHDTKSHTADALPQILAALSDEGYTFAALDSSVPMVSFGYGE